MPSELKETLYPASGRNFYPQYISGTTALVGHESVPVPGASMRYGDRFRCTGDGFNSGQAILGVEWKLDDLVYSGPIDKIRVIIRCIKEYNGEATILPTYNQSSYLWDLQEFNASGIITSIVFSSLEHVGGGAWTKDLVNAEKWGWESSIGSSDENTYVEIAVLDYRIEIWGEGETPVPTLPPQLPARTRVATPDSNRAITPLGSIPGSGDFPVICNYNESGAYSGAAPVVEDPDFPMTNLLSNDRYAIWKTGEVSSGPVVVEIDFGAGYPVDCIGVLGVHYYTSGSAPMAAVFKYLTSADGWGGVWREFENSIAYLRTAESLLFQPSVVADVRFLQITLSAGESAGSWSVAKMYGGAAVDITLWYSAGRSDTDVAPRSRVRTMGGFPYMTTYGEHYQILKLPFKTVTTVVKDKLVTIAESDTQFVISLPTGEAYECIPAGESFDVVHVFGSGVLNLWDVTLEVEVLP